MPAKTILIALLMPSGDIKYREAITETNKNLVEYAKAISKEGYLDEVRDEKGRVVETNFFPPHRVLLVTIT